MQCNAPHQTACNTSEIQCTHSGKELAFWFWGTHGVPKSVLLADVAPTILKLKKTHKFYIAIQVGG